ncbi:hypothetical protein C8Q76DRAFT_692200 [Earliella scabrosa]|nr:hypothetical protein C8Q76DRAFT_692200 [Earliella scabrosa]
MSTSVEPAKLDHTERSSESPAAQSGQPDIPPVEEHGPPHPSPSEPTTTATASGPAAGHAANEADAPADEEMPPAELASVSGSSFDLSNAFPHPAVTKATPMVSGGGGKGTTRPRPKKLQEDDDEDDEFIPRGKPTAMVSGGKPKGAGRPRMLQEEYCPPLVLS